MTGGSLKRGVTQTCDTGSSIKTLSNSSPAYAVLSINTVSIANSSLRNNDEFTHHFQVDAAPTAIVTSLSKNDQFTQSLVGAAPMDSVIHSGRGLNLGHITRSDKLSHLSVQVLQLDFRPCRV